MDGNEINNQQQGPLKEIAKQQIKQKIKSGFLAFLKTPVGMWIMIILLIIIVLFVAIIVILFATGVIYTNADSSTVASAYETGITVTDANGENAETVSIENFVKGAVYAQVGEAEDNNEYIKAMSVIIRTYAITSAMDGGSIQNNTTESIYNANYSNNSNISSNVNKTKGEFLDDDGTLYDVDITSIDKEQLKDLALEGKTYKEILAAMYGEGISVGKTSLINTEGLQLSSDGKFYMRLGMPLRTNNFYYYQDSNNYGRYYEGECAAYATCRAKEILASIESTKSWNANVNGGAYCSTSDSKKFNSSTDYTAPKPGSIVSWEKPNGINGQGHVAIIEKVEGNIVTISEAFNNLGSLGNSYIRAHDTSENRKQNCLKTACFRTTTLTIEQMKNRKSNYTFMCYIYLAEE